MKPNQPAYSGEWYQTACAELAKVAALKDGWNGSRTKSPREEAKKLADVLGRLDISLSLQPSIVPFSRGDGVEAEWCYNGRIVEIGIEAGVGLFALFSVEGGTPPVELIPEGIEEPTPEQLAVVSRYINQLMS